MEPNPSCSIMTFTPTWEEFQDFGNYILNIESKGAHKGGIAKIIPPPEYKVRKKGYDFTELDKLVIEEPKKQSTYKCQRRKSRGKTSIQKSSIPKGCFIRINEPTDNMTVKDYRQLAEKSKPPPHFTKEEIEEHIWGSVETLEGLYGSDSVGTLMDEDLHVWNINKLDSILNIVQEECGLQIEGVHTSFIYWAMHGTTFCWHTEDSDLYSINYHFGEEKNWYAIPPTLARKFEKFAESIFKNEAKTCKAFLRHKNILIDPKLLKNEGIQVNKISQGPGEIIITFPLGYHAGYNSGFNCAEASNFAMPRWIEYGKRAAVCSPVKCLVIDPITKEKLPLNTCQLLIAPFIKKFQPELYENWIKGKDWGCHPEEPGLPYFAPKPSKEELALIRELKIQQTEETEVVGPGLPMNLVLPISKSEEIISSQNVASCSTSDPRNTSIDTSLISFQSQNDHCIQINDSPAEDTASSRLQDLLITKKTRKNLAVHGGCGIKKIRASELPQAVFECPDCFKQFDFRRSFVKHVEYYAGKYPCERCNLVFRLPIHLQNHRKSHHAEETKKLKSHVAIMKRHRKPVIINSPRKSQIQRIPPSGYTLTRPYSERASHPCTECDLVFNSKRELNAHKPHHRPKGNFKCPKCEKYYHHTYDVTRHLKTLHKE